MTSPGFLRERVLIADGKRRAFWLEDISNPPFNVSRKGTLPRHDPPHWVLRGRVGRDDPITIDDPPRDSVDDYTDEELQELLEKAGRARSG